MKIQKCYVESFGTLCRQEFDFTDGVNVIKENNGWGKSTLAVFIKCMFYGLEYKRSIKSLTELKKYEPWQGGNYGGYLIFDVNDRTYRVTRYFGKKESTFELYDLSTNMPSSDYSENLGEELFGIDRESFERSIFIKLDSEKKTPELSHSISAKLTNLVDNTDDINNFDSAYKKLDRLSASIVPKRGSGGMMGAVEERIRDIDSALFECDNAKRDVARLTENAVQLENEKAKLEKRQSEISSGLEKLSLAEQKARYDRILENERNLFEKKTEYEKLFKNGVPTDMELAAQVKAVQEYDINISKLGDVPDIEQKRTRLKEIEAYLENNPKKESEKQDGTNHILAAVFGVLAAVCVIPAILLRGSVLMAIPLAAAATFTVLSLTRLKKRPVDNSAEIARVKQEMAYKALKDEIDAYEAAKKQMENAQNQIVPFLDRYNAKGSSYFEKVQYIRDAVNEYRSVSAAYDTAKAELDEFVSGHDINELETARMPTASRSELDAERRSVSARLETVTADIVRTRQSLDSRTAAADRHQELEGERAEALAQKEHLAKRHKTISKTMELLDIAKSNLTSKYMQDMTEAFDKYMHMLAPERSDIFLTVELDTQIVSGGRAKESGHHSRGFGDMANICTRLALSEVMYKGEKPFLILDDPFANMDDEKTENALVFLKEIGRERQILYFTCHKSRTVRQ